MSVEEENKALVRKWIEVCNSWESMEMMDKFFTPDFKDHVGNQDFQGIESWVQMEVKVQKGFPDLHDSIEDIIAEGDKVWVRLKITGTHKGEFLGLAPTGKKFSYQCVAIYRIVDGKIVERWLVNDRMDYYKQLGIAEYKGFPEENTS